MFVHSPSRGVTCRSTREVAASKAAAPAEHGRAGAPLYLLYGADGGKPKILPQLLTEGMVKSALKDAAKAA